MYLYSHIAISMQS